MRQLLDGPRALLEVIQDVDEYVQIDELGPGTYRIVRRFAAPPGAKGQWQGAETVVTVVADELTNTPTVCRKSYVHEAIVTAFEEGALARLGKPSRSAAKKAEVLARIVARHSS